MTLSNNKQPKIQLTKVVSKNLIFRNSADDLFKQINNLEASEIIIDFNKIQTITRSFAQQYLVNKVKSEKNIIDINLSPNIKSMFELVGKNTS